MHTVSTTFHPAFCSAWISGLYFPRFLLAAFSGCKSEAHASSPIIRTRTVLRSLLPLWRLPSRCFPSGDSQRQCVTGPPVGGSAVISGHPSSTTIFWLHSPGGGFII
eukprot:6388859-Pyramimonas_sp.AAC.1